MVAREDHGLEPLGLETPDAGTRPHLLAEKDVVGSREWHDVVANLFIS